MFFRQTSLCDGMSAPADWFEPVPVAGTEPDSTDPGGEPSTLRDKVRARGQQVKASPQKATQPEPPPPQEQDQTRTVFDPAQLLKEIQACTDIEILDLLADELRDLPEGDERAQLEAAYRERRSALSNT